MFNIDRVPNPVRIFFFKIKRIDSLQLSSKKILIVIQIYPSL